MPPGFFDGSALSHSHPMLDLGEGLFDGIEVGGVGGQIPKLCAFGPYGSADLNGFVAAQIVHHHDISRADGSEQLLVDPCPEACSVDRAVEDAGGHDPVAAQGGHEGQGAPMAVRGIAAHPLALGAPATDWGHVGLDPCLVDKYQASGIEVRLDGLPALASPGDGGTTLLKREQDFF